MQRKKSNGHVPFKLKANRIKTKNPGFVIPGAIERLKEKVLRSAKAILQQR